MKAYLQQLQKNLKDLVIIVDIKKNFVAINQIEMKSVYLKVKPVQ